MLWLIFLAPATQPVVQPAPGQPWWQPLVVPILAALGTALAALITAAINRLIKVLEAKYKVEVPVAIQQLVIEKAKELVAAAEEAAERKLLHEGGAVTTGAEKQKDVLTALSAFVKANGFETKYPEEELKKLVDGIVHLGRAGSYNVIGSNGDRATALAAAAKAAEKK